MRALVAIALVSCVTPAPRSRDWVDFKMLEPIDATKEHVLLCHYMPETREAHCVRIDAMTLRQNAQLDIDVPQQRLAQDHAEHGFSPAQTEQEKCRDTCHQKHCDGYRACNLLWPDASSPERDKCKQDVEKEEERCMQICNAA